MRRACFHACWVSLVAGAVAACGTLLGVDPDGPPEPGAGADGSASSGDGAPGSDEGGGGDGSSALDGGADAAEIAFMLLNPKDLAFGNGLLAIATDDAVYVWSEVDGGTPTMIASAPDGPKGLTVFEGVPYWISGGNVINGFDGGVCATSAGKPADHFAMSPNATYWSSSNGGAMLDTVNSKICDSLVASIPSGATAVMASDGTNAYRARLDGGRADILVCSINHICEQGDSLPIQNIAAPSLLVADVQSLYWTDGPLGAEALKKAGKSGAPAPSAVFDAGASIDGLAAQGGTVWFTVETGVLYMSNGPSAMPVLTGLDGPHGVAVSPKWVYVAESNTGRVLRVKRQ